MKTCPKCKAQFSDDTAFCEKCGTPLSADPAPATTVTCPACKNQCATGENFCPKCGFRFQGAAPVDPAPQNNTAAAAKKRRLTYYFLAFFAVVIMCVVIFVIADSVKQSKIDKVHVTLFRDWDTELDPSDTKTIGLQLDFTVNELSINLYRYSGGQRHYNKDVITYKYEVISPTCIKAWYKDDPPKYFDISFNDDYTVMYFEYGGETIVLYPHHIY